MKMKFIAFLTLAGTMLCLERLEGAHPPPYTSEKNNGAATNLPAYTSSSSAAAFNQQTVEAHGPMPKFLSSDSIEKNNEISKPPSYELLFSKQTTPLNEETYGYTPDYVCPKQDISAQFLDVLHTMKQLNKENSSQNIATIPKSIPSNHNVFFIINKTEHNIVVDIQKNPPQTKKSIFLKKIITEDNRENYILENKNVPMHSKSSFAVLFFSTPLSTTPPFYIIIKHDGLYDPLYVTQPLTNYRPILKQLKAFTTNNTITIYYSQGIITTEESDTKYSHASNIKD